MADDLRLISQLKVLIVKAGYNMPLVSTEPCLIVPAGASGYCLDDDANVTGLKLGPISEKNNEIVDLIVKLRRLQRLVLVFSVPTEIPKDIGNLSDLRFLYLSGQVKKNTSGHHATPLGS